MAARFIVFYFPPCSVCEMSVVNPLIITLPSIIIGNSVFVLIIFDCLRVILHQITSNMLIKKMCSLLHMCVLTLDNDFFFVVQMAGGPE